MVRRYGLGPSFFRFRILRLGPVSALPGFIYAPVQNEVKKLGVTPAGRRVGYLIRRSGRTYEPVALKQKAHR